MWQERLSGRLRPELSDCERESRERHRERTAEDEQRNTEREDERVTKGKDRRMRGTRRRRGLSEGSGRMVALARDERGDVPGWVLITLMTAGLVIIIWGLAGPALSGVFQQAIERVTSF